MHKQLCEAQKKRQLCEAQGIFSRLKTRRER